MRLKNIKFVLHPWMEKPKLIFCFFYIFKVLSFDFSGIEKEDNEIAS